MVPVLVLALLAGGGSLAPVVAAPAGASAPTWSQSGAPSALPGDRARAYFEFLRGRMLEAADQADQALAAYEQALRLDPSSADINAEIAALHARQGRAHEAIAAAERAVALHAANVEANRVLGLVYASLADSEEDRGNNQRSAEFAVRAVQHLEVVEQAPIFPEPGILLALGRLALRTGAYGKAIRALTRLAEQVPDAPEVQGLLAEAEAGSGRPEAAIERLEAVVQRDPRQYPALGELYAGRRRWIDAARVYEKIVAADGGNLEAKTNLAQALLNLDDPVRLPQARDLLQAVLGARASDAQALFLLVQVQQALGDLDEAETAARRLIAVRPGLPVAHAALAELLVGRGRHDAALEVLREAEAKFPTDVTILFQKGAVLERQERYADAEAAFTQVLARDPLHAPALNYLGYMLADRGERLDESVEFIKRALAVEPENAAYLDSLGWAYFKLGRLDLAEPPLRQAAGMRPRDSIVQDHFAQALFKLGRYDEAIAAWERALAGDGVDVDRKVIEGRIRAAREKLPRR